eukprot:608126_1
MGSCFGRNRDQDDHNIVNEGLLENEIDLESQQVTTPPTHSFPKYGSLSSLVPSKRLVLAVIGAFLLLVFIIGGYRHFKKNGGDVTNSPQNNQMDIANDDPSNVLESINVVDSASDDGSMDNASTGSPNKFTRTRRMDSQSVDDMDSAGIVSPKKFTRARRRMESESVDDMDSASTGSLTNSMQHLSPTKAVAQQSATQQQTRVVTQPLAPQKPNPRTKLVDSNDTNVELQKPTTSSPTAPP